MTREEIGQIMNGMSAPVDPEGLRLETQRLILRPVELSDFDDIHEICTQPEVSETAGWQLSEDEEMSRKRLQSYMEDGETVAVVLKEENKVIGTVSLQKRPWHTYPIDQKLRGREYGFDLNKYYWGRGLMPEAVMAINRHCFENLGFDFLTAGHFRGNTRSEGAIKKCGFQYLFENDVTLPRGDTLHVHTYILYHPRKEIHHV